MPTGEQAHAGLDNGGTDGPAAGRLGIHPGPARMIATGMPADGRDVPTDEEPARPGAVPTSTLAVPPWMIVRRRG